MHLTTLFLTRGRGRIFQITKISKPHCISWMSRCLSSLPLPEKDDDPYNDLQGANFNEERQKMKFIESSPSIYTDSKTSSIKSDDEEIQEVKNPPETRQSRTQVTYTGNVTLPLTSILKIWYPNGENLHEPVFPVFRLMDEDGTFRNSNVKHQIKHEPLSSLQLKNKLDDPLRAKLLAEYNHDPVIINELNENFLLRSSAVLKDAHRLMIRLRQMDTILQNAQRQGRISFYMCCRGEEAIHIGSASALTMNDTIWAQYREAGVLMWRGFTLDQFTAQCFSNCKDLGRGRQMPVHYGCRALNYHTISSPLGTQIIQAVGAAYHYKLEAFQKQQRLEGCSVVYFGDGSSSASDFHAGCNFAATLECPVIFICRNNGFAISTPVSEQYRGDGIIGRAPGYGMAALRVDGNDVFAVSAAIREARKYVMEHCKPIMVETMTYRQSHHSTSDDSTRYRCRDEVHEWASVGDPLKRIDRFMSGEKMMDETERAVIKDEERMAVLQAMEKAEKLDKPDLKYLFEDVYEEKPDNLQRQEAALLEHLKKHGDHYKSGHH